MNELRIGCGYLAMCLASLVLCGFVHSSGNGRGAAVEVVSEPVETSVSAYETTVTTMTSTVIEAVTTTSESVTEAVTSDFRDDMTYLGSFTGTYYKGATVPCHGGSGRMLVSCYEKETWFKGSVASRLVYERYGYYVNDKTMVYVEFRDYPRMNGWYSVDDCNADPSIVDFYFADYTTCPWQNDGLTSVEMWIGGVE